MMRAIRRHHYERLKNKVKTYHRADGVDESHLGSIANTPCSCSCHLCGKHFNKGTKADKVHLWRPTQNDIYKKYL